MNVDVELKMFVEIPGREDAGEEEKDEICQRLADHIEKAVLGAVEECQAAPSDLSLTARW